MATKTASTKKAKKPLVTLNNEMMQILKEIEDVQWAMPVTHEPIKEYAVKITWSRMGRDGEMYEGNLYKNGQIICVLDDNGNGGGVDLHSVELDGWKAENEFREACKLAYADDSYMTAEQAIFILDVIGNQL
tara:strand:+ start:165 stop:560 length:396 start_codon:yes stop_codon:yes gene_type:complete